VLTQEQTGEIRVMARSSVAVKSIAHELGGAKPCLGICGIPRARRYKKPDPRANKPDGRKIYWETRVE